MRLESVLLRAIVAFALLGVMLFGVRGLFGVGGPAHDRTPQHAIGEESTTTATRSLVTPELLDWIEARIKLGVLLAREGLQQGPDVPPAPQPHRIQIEPIAEPELQLQEPPDLEPLAKELTPGRSAALRVILAGGAYLLYFGAPDGDAPEPEPEPAISVIGIGTSGYVTRQRFRDEGFRYESVGDSVDPLLARYVHDFNLQMRHARRAGLVRTRAVDGVWSTAARLDEDADDVLFDLLDDPTDATATGFDPETGAYELDLGHRDGIEMGMRFVLWTQGRPLRRVLALAQVDRVLSSRCQVHLVKRLGDSWPALPGIRASNPFFVRGRTAAGIVLGKQDPTLPERFANTRNATIHEKLPFPAFCVVGDVPDGMSGKRSEESIFLERSRHVGAILVPGRLVRYLLPLP